MRKATMFKFKQKNESNVQVRYRSLDGYGAKRGTIAQVYPTGRTSYT